MTQRDPGPGWVWRPGADPSTRPLQVVVAVVVLLVLLGVLLSAFLD